MDEITVGITFLQPTLGESIDELLNDLQRIQGISLATLASDENPAEGAKGFSAGISTVLAKIAEHGGIQKLAQVLGKWLTKDSYRTIKIQVGSSSLEATCVTEEEQKALIQWFTRQVTQTTGTTTPAK